MMKDDDKSDDREKKGISCYKIKGNDVKIMLVNIRKK